MTRELLDVPTTCGDMLRVDTFNRCVYTNCIVDGRPSDCYSKGFSEYNGCGTENLASEFPTTDFGDYSFGQACCVHDFCYASVIGKADCDQIFYNLMILECTKLCNDFRCGSEYPTCLLHALAYYSVVAVIFWPQSQDAYRSSQIAQNDYERNNPRCNYYPTCRCGTGWVGNGCINCDPGEFSDSNDLTSCQHCPVGTYQPNSGACSCIPCVAPNEVSEDRTACMLPTTTTTTTTASTTTTTSAPPTVMAV